MGTNDSANAIISTEIATIDEKFVSFISCRCSLRCVKHEVAPDTYNIIIGILSRDENLRKAYRNYRLDLMGVYHEQ